MSIKQLLNKANRKSEMRWKVLVFDPEKDNELVDEFKDFDNIDCAAMKKREILDKHPNRTVEIIAESVKQRTSEDFKAGDAACLDDGRKVQIISKSPGLAGHGDLTPAYVYKVKALYGSGHTFSIEEYKLHKCHESSLNDLGDAENDELRALDREELEANESLNMDKLSDEDAKELIVHLSNFIKDKSSKYYHIDKIEKILKTKFKAESSQKNEADDKTLIAWLQKEFNEAMKLAKFTGYRKEQREYYRGQAMVYARLADKFGVKL